MDGRRTTFDDRTTARHLEEIAELAQPMDAPTDLDPLLDRVGGARFVLLGEASHGTAEYYRWRTGITRRLVEEKGFSFVAVEGDWPDCYRVNRWVKDLDGDGRSARQVLGAFERWPTWMWANEEVVELVDWMREHNAGRDPAERVGFYGLDVYSLWDSLRSVMDYLGEHEPDAMETAVQAWRCFEPYAEDPQDYAWATRLVPQSCEDAVVDLLRELRGRTSEPAPGADAEEVLDARQNAEVARGAERYYRTMVRSDGSSWNVRDTHMADTLDRLVAHHGDGARAVVWEHNTHIGDARATDMARAGMVNIGQLVRERHGEDDVVLVGFAGYEGSVIAGSAWGSPFRRMPVPPAAPGSHEDLVHRSGGERSLFVFPRDREVDWLVRPRGHRAIGVVYHPDRERHGNWVPSVLGRRYDVFCVFDRTEALHPITAEHARPGAELESYPFGE